MGDHSFTLKTIQRFPVKGMSAEPMNSVVLCPGDGLPGDRLFGFARHGSGFDPKNPKPLPKDRFVVLLNEAALAGLKTHFDADTLTLNIDGLEGGATFDMNKTSEQERAARYLYETLDLSDPHAPFFVSAAPHRFTDVSVVSAKMMNAVSILNLASVRDLERRLDVPINPDRFRANLVIDGLDPWIELDAVGQNLTISDLNLQIIQRTKRCAATEVNPETAQRDLRLPYLLRKETGHMDMGVYAEVVDGGVIKIGQSGHLSVG